jgi:hypothetical protein
MFVIVGIVPLVLHRDHSHVHDKRPLSCTSRLLKFLFHSGGEIQRGDPAQGSNTCKSLHHLFHRVSLKQEQKFHLTEEVQIVTISHLQLLLSSLPLGELGELGDVGSFESAVARTNEGFPDLIPSNDRKGGTAEFFRLIDQESGMVSAREAGERSNETVSPSDEVSEAEPVIVDTDGCRSCSCPINCAH